MTPGELNILKRRARLKPGAEVLPFWSMLWVFLVAMTTLVIRLVMEPVPQLSFSLIGGVLLVNGLAALVICIWIYRKRSQLKAEAIRVLAEVLE